MTQFKIHDRVTIVSSKWDGKHHVSPFRKGAVVEIVRPAITKYFDWYVQPLDGTTSLLPVRENELQYAPEPEKKFKVGQLVHLWGPDSHVFQILPDVEGVDKGRYDYRVQNTETGSSCWAFEKELTPVPQSLTLRRGDRIVNLKTGRQGHVVEGQDEELWVVDDSYEEETGAPARAVEEYEHHYPGTYELTNRKETEGPF